MRRLSTWLLGLLLTVVELSAFDSDAFLLRPLLTQKQLPSNTVNSIIQDKRGYLWFGTQDGLARYDGYEVKHVDFPEDCKSYDSVITLCEDDHGRIWTGSSQGIAVVDCQSCQVRKYSSGRVQRLIKSRDGNIWVAGQYAGFLRIDPETFVCDTLAYEYHNASAHFGSGVCYDGDDTMYFINGLGALYRCGLKDDSLELLMPYTDSPFKMLNIGRILYVNGCIVGGVPEKTIIYRLYDGAVIYKSWSVLCDAVSFGDNFVLAMDSGIKVIDKDFNLLYDNDKLKGENVPHDSYALSVCVDDEGGILFGTTSDAVWRFNPNYLDWKVYDKVADDVEDVCVRRLAVGNDGKMWVATKNSGLLYLDRGSDKLVRHWLPIRSDMNALGFVGRHLMVGFNSIVEPLVGIDMVSGTVKKYSGLPSLPTCFMDSGNGTFLMGSSGRLSSIDISKGTSQRLEKVRTTVSTIFEGHGRIWAATMSTGLWSCKDGRWKHYTDSIGVSMAIYDAVPDESGIWLATGSHGLQYLDAQTDEIKSIESFGGVTCTRMGKLAFDADGVLWITTAKGVATYMPESGQSSFYSFYHDGIFDKSMSISSITPGLDSLMFLGSKSGLLSFNPRRALSNERKVGRIVFTDFHITNIIGGGRAGRSDYIRSVIDSLDQIRLKADENSFVLRVSDMNYSLPRTTSLAYMLEGYSNGWEKVDDGKIVITSLDPGTYNLKVCSITRTGQRLGNERKVTIVVSRPVFASIVAVILYLIILVSVLSYIIIYSRRKAVRDAEEAAAVVAERNEAENQKRLYASKVEFLLNIAHEIRTPLALVKAPVETLCTKLSDHEDKSVSGDLDIILHNSDVLSNMLDELLDINKFENSGYEINVAEEDISQLVETTSRRFAYAIRSKRLNFSLSLPQTPILAAVDKVAMDKIIGNLLYNAIKYSSSSIAMKLDRSGDDFVVVIENDGQTVPLSERERIFQPFERYTSTQVKTTGTGIGLFVSRNLAQLHGGTLAMDEDTDVNRFILVIPIAHMSGKPAGIADLPEFGMNSDRPTILLVEDNDDMRGFISRQFESVYNVIEASDGEKAMKLLNLWTGNLPDAVVSDVMMPGMDGYELCRQIKSDDRFCVIPVLLLTARSDVNSRVQGWEYGADAYMPKPFSVRELLAQVSNMIENRRLLHMKYLSLSEDAADSVSSAFSQSSDVEFVKVIDEYITTNIDKENISVSDLASVSCMSESSLFKKMKGLLGIGPGEYILLARLKRASVLLKDHSLSIADISTMVGFRSHTTFSTAFRKQFGMSPKDFRGRKSGAGLK